MHWPATACVRRVAPLSVAPRPQLGVSRPAAGSSDLRPRLARGPQRSKRRRLDVRRRGARALGDAPATPLAAWPRPPIDLGVSRRHRRRGPVVHPSSVRPGLAAGPGAALGPLAAFLAARHRGLPVPVHGGERPDVGKMLVGLASWPIPTAGSESPTIGQAVSRVADPAIGLVLGVGFLPALGVRVSASRPSRAYSRRPRMNRLAVLLATSRARLLPGGPGTAGSAVGIVIYFLTRHWSAPEQIGLLA